MSTRPQIVIRPSYTNRRSLLLHSHSSSVSTCSSRSRIAEVAGGTTAECAAICCCCTCGLVNLLLLPIYKVPAGLCRRARRKKRLQRLMTKKDLLPPGNRRCQCGFNDTELEIHPFCREEEEFQKRTTSKEEEMAVEELEKEMLARFYGGGFWRSPSQR
ncbi:hypothetical protein HS088_TW03G00948 [Tripterygium wilfordii]|uniref:Uncharacterized protein n=1 Tax=Tripterygium wilfordii TaxID=458696 RepID=A0A7J7DWE3_TRIWF|nr:uncharacterized protein LOC119987106 [Tripterygium wilfordii]KAF5750609.1 hypothetical protein HS088_TW03G00948 [Tripterygium wilfordii]